MYGNKPKLWSETLHGDDRLRFIVNALTRLRVVDTEGRMYLKFKDAADQAPAGTMPWFDHPERATRDNTDRVRPLVERGARTPLERGGAGYRLRMGRQADGATPW